MSPLGSSDCARLTAMLKFDGALQIKEAYRDRQGWPTLEHVIQDLRYAIRVHSKRPILLVTTISIGIGVGVNVAMYSRFEIGLPIALGAPCSALMRLMMRDTIVMVGVGSMVGVVISCALIRAIWPLLADGQRSMMAVALIAVFILIFTVGLVAALRPALRAAALDPMGALRQD
jgi:hypothetical protein